MNILSFAQIPNLPTSQSVTPQNPFGTPNVVNPTAEIKNSMRVSNILNNTNPESDKIRRQNEMLMQQANEYSKKVTEINNQRKVSEKLQKDYTDTYFLPSLSDKAGAKAYYSAFGNLSKFNPEDYSIADATFLVENAFYNNDKNFQNTYQNYIQKATKIIQSDINKKGISDDDNASKNLAVFKYFSKDSKQNGKVVHKAIKYDFDDYWGAKDYSKMFVSKLMRTNSGQCHSMPLLYLILAEQIGADASLVLIPNHSYIRFIDNDGEMLSIELTNGMFSTNTFVINNGYIKSEALQNKIYMQNLTKKELLSQTFVDLASGYIHKYGYDEFVNQVLEKALELNPNNINATLWQSNLNQERFVKASNKLGINPHDQQSLQNIKNYPELVAQLKNINGQFDYIDHSGFAQMPPEQYEKWLGSLKNTENKQKNDEILEKMQLLQAQKKKEELQKQKQQQIKKPVIKKEAPKYYTIPKELL